MSALFSVLLWSVGVVSGLLLLLVLTPIHAQLEGAVDDERLEGRALLRWGWWVVVWRVDSEAGIDARVLGLRVWRYRRGPEKGEADEVDDEGPSPWWRRGPGMGAGLWRGRYALKRVAATVFGAIPVRGWICGTVGLSDPADTGALFGVLDPVASWPRVIELDVQPSWIDETLELEGAVGVRLWPIQVMLALLWLLIRDGRARRGVWALARAN